MAYHHVRTFPFKSKYLVFHMEQLTSNPYMIPECAYAVDANTLFERSL
ncbi:MAG: hypothetical protein QXK37_06585 [Candidatus Woesearchaeota archaeon]